MTRLAVPSGTPLAVAAARSTVRGYGGSVPVQAAVNVLPHTGSGSYAEDGAWVEIWAATTAPINLLHIGGTTDLLSNRTNTKIDIAIGGAGSEVEHVSDVACGYGHHHWIVPCNIPVGSRVAIRVASFAVGARQFMVAGMRAPLRRTARRLLRLDAAANNGCFGVTLATPGGANTEGAWTELVAATAQPMQALWLWPQLGGDTTVAAATTLVDVAVGSAGNKVELFTDLGFVATTAEAMSAVAGFGVPLECNIPAGTRIAARYKSTETTNVYDLALMGVPA